MQVQAHYVQQITLLVTLIMAGSVADCCSAALVFTDRALFEAAAGSTSTEDFEGFPLNAQGFGAFSNGQSFGAFTVTSLVLSSDIDLLATNLDDTGLDGTFLVDEDNGNSSVRPGGQGPAGSAADNDDFVIDYINPVAASGLDILDNTAEPGESILFLDSIGNTIVSAPLPSGAGSFIGVVTMAGDPLIASIVVNEGTPLNDDILFDNVTFSTAAVPEPSSLLLSLMSVTGLLGYGARTRRREGNLEAS